MEDNLNHVVYTLQCFLFSLLLLLLLLLSSLFPTCAKRALGRLINNVENYFPLLEDHCQNEFTNNQRIINSLSTKTGQKFILLQIFTIQPQILLSSRLIITNVRRMASAALPPTEDDELTLPRASINKMIKEILPHVRVANESRELILNCCTEFIHLLSSEANEICNQQQKKTINAEHVLQALEKLGFGDYSAEAEAVLRDCKAVAAKRRRQSTRLENLGIPEEELLRQQQELFAKAREEQAVAEQQQWQQLQAVAQMASMQQNDSEQEDYS